MQRIRFTIFITLLSALSAPAFGKSTTQLDNGDFLTVIDATAGGAFTTEPHDFTYFSFEDQDVVVLTDAEAAESAEWHIAFKRSEISGSTAASAARATSWALISQVPRTSSRKHAFDAISCDGHSRCRRLHHRRASLRH